MTLHLPVDHFVVLVHDLEDARQVFLAAGFSATPVSRHSDEMGTANSCVMLDGGYIELMGMVAGTPANEGWRALLGEGPGLRGIALASGDIDATAAMLTAKGIDAGPPRHFSRATSEGELRFSVIRLPRALTPGLQCIYCRHHTPELLWTPQAMRHDNGASRIVSARAAGIDALRPLAVAAGLPVEDGAEGEIGIAMARPVAPEALDAIRHAAGIRIAPRTTA